MQEAVPNPMDEQEWLLVVPAATAALLWNAAARYGVDRHAFALDLLRQVERPGAASLSAPSLVARSAATEEYASLKPTARRVFDRVCAALVAGEPAPTVREIGAAVGLCSPCSVMRHLKQLVALRLLRRDPHKFRGLRLHERFYGAG